MNVPPADGDDESAADQSFAGSYRTLVEHVDGAEMRTFGGVTAYSTKLPLSIFNVVLALTSTTPNDAEAAIDWLETKAAPFEVLARDAAVEDIAGPAAAHGLVPEPRPFPGMVLWPVPAQPDTAARVSVRAVDSPQALEEHVAVLVDIGVDAETARRLFPASWLADPDTRLFTGYLEGRPVATALAIRTGDVSGVYNVGTHPSAMRQGVGRAVTSAAVEAGRSWGCDRVVLQASAMGEPLYRRMGFRTVVAYRTFGRARGG